MRRRSASPVLASAVLALGLLTACGGDQVEGAKGQEGLQPSAEGSPVSQNAAPPGDSLPRCEQVIRVGQQVNAQVVTTGCQDEQAKTVTIDTTKCPDGRQIATFRELRGEVGTGTWEKSTGEACAAG